jgi:hypothetical protein
MPARHHIAPCSACEFGSRTKGSASHSVILSVVKKWRKFWFVESSKMSSNDSVMQIAFRLQSKRSHHFAMSFNRNGTHTNDSAWMTGGTEEAHRELKDKIAHRTKWNDVIANERPSETFAPRPLSSKPSRICSSSGPLPSMSSKPSMNHLVNQTISEYSDPG